MSRSELEELRRLEELESRAAGGKPAAPAAPTDNSMFSEAKRQLGLTGRYALEGAGALPAAIGNLMAKIPGMEGAAGNPGTGAADYLGLPRAEREGEKIVSDITQTLVPGAGAYSGVSKAVGAAPGLVRAIARNVGGGAAAGAAGNAALDKDVGEGAMYGAALGPLTAGAGAGAKELYSLGSRMFGGAGNEATRVMQKSFGDRLPTAIAALRNLKGNVAGEMPTAGRAATAELPELKILEEAARRKPGAERYLMRDEANEAARLATIEKYAAPGREGVAAGPGAPVPKSQLDQARLDRTRPMYEQADVDRVTITPELDEMINGPEVRGAVQRGSRSFRQDQTNASVAGRPVPRSRTAPDPDAGVPGDYSIRELQKTKDQLTGQINQLVGQDLPSVTRRNQLIEARNQLTGMMTEQSPNYAAANAAYRQMSAPVNQSAVAQQLAGALRGTKGDEQIGAYLRAMENAPQTIKKAGTPRFSQIEQIATAKQLRDYGNVRSSLQREADYAGLATPEGILPRYLSPADKLESMTPGIFSQPVTIARSILKRIGRQSDEQVFKVLNDAMLDPNKMADLLAKIPAAQRSEFLNSINSAGARGTMTGAMTPSGE